MARRKLYYIADGGTVQGVETPPPVIIANGNYPASPGWINWEGGWGEVQVVGTFDSSTAKLQIQAADGSTWLDVTGASFTASGRATFQAAAGRLRLNVAAVAAASSQKAYVIGIPANEGG